MDFFNPDITPEMTRATARRAWFSMNVSVHDGTGMDGINGGEYRLAGEGVDTLDKALNILANGTNVSYFPHLEPVIQLDYGAVGEGLQRVGKQNIHELRAAFVSIFGPVNRPDVYSQFDSWNGKDETSPLPPPPPPVDGFKLYGHEEPFTLYGSTEPFELVL